MKTWSHLAELRELVGTQIGSSDWIEVDQARIDRFADATGDHQWIHVDPERAAAGPFGTTIAHGFLTLSLLPQFFASTYAIADSPMGINYGLNRVRFTAPVPVGSRLRARMRLESYEDIPGGAQLQFEVSVEREGQERLVCVAQAIVRRYTG
jgi:acyl dehydratase